jgi:TolB-like protein/cytochrome c-type biogenesis protein CcmH/NrfG/predicted Ser/Thr protein kinase
MALPAGARLGPYEVEHRLGAGGMGEVYRGHDTRLGRAVALKVISQGLVGDEASRRRFETEARAASALNHPAIVTIYDIGESDDVSWIAMELVEGRTLREVIAQGPLPIRQAWSIARQLADGLAAAHAKRIVHRDLKPENVMVTDEGAVKVLDFGVARQAVASTLDDAAAAATVTGSGTVAGVILGTAGYMSPEQATGQGADFRSDQFSFGAVIYELLTGQRAFRRPSPVETLSAILRDEPPPVGSIRQDASEAFQRVIGRCLEKSPAQRFSSTRELAAALEALTPESSGTVAPTGPALPDRPGERAARPAPSRLWVAALAAVVIAVAAAGAYLWNQWRAAALPAITSVAVLPFENTAQDPAIEYIADGLTDGVIDHLTRAKPLKVMARATVMRFKGQGDPQEAARALKVGAVVTGALSRRGNDLVVSAELIDGATGERLWGQPFDLPMADLMRVQDSIVVAIAEGLRLRLSGEEKARLGGFGTSNPEAYQLFLKGRFRMESDTEEDDIEARKLFEEAAEKDPNFLDAYLAISSTYARAGNSYMAPREAMKHADAALEKAAAIDPHNIAVRVAIAHRRFTLERDWAATEREYRAVMNDPAVLRTVQYHPISLFFVAIGHADEAVALVKRALEVDPGNLESRVMLGNFQLQAGRLDDAFRTYTAIAAEAPDDARPLFGIADLYRRRADFARAAEARRKAHELEGDADFARAFAGAKTEAEYAKAEMTVARAALRAMEERAAMGGYVPPLDLARMHAQVGNRERALAGLEGVVMDPYAGLMLLRVDEAWNSVRSDPRFAAVVRQVGIP